MDILPHGGESPRIEHPLGAVVDVVVAEVEVVVVSGDS